MTLKSVHQIMFIRRTSILVAACWHLCVTAVILPAHALLHASDTRTLVANTTQLDCPDLEVTGQHHADNCQFCKLDSQFQPASFDTSGYPVDPTTTGIVPGDPAHRRAQISDHFSGRAPPAGMQTTPAVV